MPAEVVSISILLTTPPPLANTAVNKKENR